MLTAHGWGKLEGERGFVATNGAVGHGAAILPANGLELEWQ